MREFDRQKLVSYFKGLMLTRVKDSIAKQLVREKISILEISANLNSISQGLHDEMREEFTPYGVKLVNFFINSINTRYSYQQERTFDTMQTAAGNEGTAGGMMGAGMGMGMGVGMGVGPARYQAGAW
jgi:membrane protease subunit (stomatin/prohibitin family)